METDTEFLAVSETRFNSEFLDSQFAIENYTFPPLGRDRNEFGGGLMEMT